MSPAAPAPSAAHLRVAIHVQAGRQPPEFSGWEARTVHTADGLVALLDEWDPEVVLLIEPAPSLLPSLYGRGAAVVLASDVAPPEGVVFGLGVHAWLPANHTPSQLRATIHSAARRTAERAELRRHQEVLHRMLGLASTMSSLRTPEEVTEHGLIGFVELLAARGSAGAVVVRFSAADPLHYAGVGSLRGLQSDLDLPVPVVEAVARVFGAPERLERIEDAIVVGIAGNGGTAGALYVEKAELPSAFDDLGAVVAGLFGQALSNAVLFQRSAHDTLTGLYARGFGLHRLGEVLAFGARYAAPTTVLMLDLDHFKLVNDEHGHPGGDVVLAGVARVIQQTLRATDIAVRWGGEEFLVIMPRTDQAAAAGVAERLRVAIAAWRGAHEGRPLAVTVSIGAAEADDNERDGAALVSRADDALYEAKRAGRDRVVCAG